MKEKPVNAVVRSIHGGPYAHARPPREDDLWAKP